MNISRPTIMIVEDNAGTRMELADAAKQIGFQCVTVCEDVGEAVTKWHDENGFDFIILDLDFRNERDKGFQFLCDTVDSRLRKAPTVLIYSGFLGEFRRQLDALRNRNSVHCYHKPRERDKLIAELQKRFRELQTPHGANIVVASRHDRQLHAEIPDIAASGLRVLITGETGSGKEWVAQRIAELSGRDSALIRTVNCAAFHEPLLMSELFGHLRDSFTGANSHRLGLVLEASGYRHDGTKGQGKEYRLWLSADPASKPEKRKAANGEVCFALPKGTVGGTLILDEVAELSSTAQASLLRILDGLPIKPVGYDGPGFLPNVRVIAATNDVEKLRRPDKFRPDLLARLNDWHVEVSPIKDRPETAKQIVEKTAMKVEFRNKNGELREISFTVNEPAMNAFVAKLGQLEGGIRELISWVRRACVLADRDNETVISEQHANAAWERSFRITDRNARDLGQTLDATDASRPAAVKADQIRKRLHELMPRLRLDFVFKDFDAKFRGLENLGKQEIHKLLWGLFDKGRTTFEQRREVFIAMRYTGWDKTAAKIGDTDLAKLSNRLSKLMPKSKPFGAA